MLSRKQLADQRKSHDEIMSGGPEEILRQLNDKIENSGGEFQALVLKDELTLKDQVETQHRLWRENLSRNNHVFLIKKFSCEKKIDNIPQITRMLYVIKVNFAK